MDVIVIYVCIYYQAKLFPAGVIIHGETALKYGNILKLFNTSK